MLDSSAGEVLTRVTTATWPWIDTFHCEIWEVAETFTLLPPHAQHSSSESSLPHQIVPIPPFAATAARLAA